MDKKMLDALNNQIQEELGSAYLYFAMASDFEAKNLKGFAHWMKMQAVEEMNHAYKIFGYISESGEQAVFQGLDTPQANWETPLAAFKAAYQHEQHITGCIHNLMKLARELNDFATENMLQWFVAEQVEEEASADEVVQNLKMLEGSKQGLFIMDKEMAARPAAQFWVVNPPVGI